MPQPQDYASISVAAERAILVAIHLPNSVFDPDDPLGELQALTETAGSVVVDTLIQKRRKPEPATFMGKGKTEELRDLAQLREAKVVIFDCDLRPSQIRNIEEIVQCKVIDRSELILDIFAQRATTIEAKHQVELAQLEYTYPRLRAMWSHLERIVGGAPTGLGTRGPGEQQIEIDRRIVQQRKAELRREIEEIHARKVREVTHRNTDYYTVGLVGYTNAGKSTLFNAVTAGGAYADDKLFATLASRTREWDLGGGNRIMLTDTVGFVRDLPHHLIASFRATLEEAMNADLLLVVLDVADRRSEHHLQVVTEVLDSLQNKQAEAPPIPRLIVLNKADRLLDNAELLIWHSRAPGCIVVSALTGDGLDVLIERVLHHMKQGDRHVVLSIPLADSRAINFIENRADVLDRAYTDSHARFEVRIGRRQLDQLRSAGTEMRIEPVAADD
ncbi:MAG: GTPase HflX [Phycisphaerales bacterium]|nr:GTPase HflX [Phycisphaerales bacterium]